MKGMNGVLSSKPAFGYAQRNPKFQQENICRETEDYLIHLDGILLSHPKPAREDERFQLLTRLYREYGAAMLTRLKGLFTMAVWDKRAQKALVANDLLSKRPLYYCVRGGQLFYAAAYRDLVDLLSRCGHRPPISAQAVRAMADTGSLPENLTYLEDVYYLEAYQALECDLASGEYRVITLDPRPIEAPDGLEQAVQRFDEVFTRAVRAQFAKNEEYGYAHFAALSGGMDSRACLLKALQCGYAQGITCFNYSPADSMDHVVSRQIAFDNDLDYLHYAMDAAVFMTRLTDAADRNECQQSCIGSTGAGTFALLLDKSRMGIVHVGLCGGELMGDLVEHAAPIGRVERVMERLGRPAHGQCVFRRREYLNHTRACRNFASMFLDDCDCASPFLDEDVVAFVSQLDPALLYRRRLYRAWMVERIPNPYPTTMFCGPVDISPLREALNKAADALVRRVSGTSRREMNPFDYWLKTKPQRMADCARLYEDGMAQLRQSGVCADVLTPIAQAWERSGESRFFALTAVWAIQDIQKRQA